jgi:hypothetical protein
MIENIAQTTFEELNRDLPEIGSVSASTEFFLSKLTSWLTGGGNKHSNREETVIEQKKSGCIFISRSHTRRHSFVKDCPNGTLGTENRLMDELPPMLPTEEIEAIRREHLLRPCSYAKLWSNWDDMDNGHHHDEDAKNELGEIPSKFFEFRPEWSQSLSTSSNSDPSNPQDHSRKNLMKKKGIVERALEYMKS